MDKRFRACSVPYVERLALQTKLTLARKNSKVVLVSFGTIVMDEYWSLCRTDVKGTLSLLADALVRPQLSALGVEHPSMGDSSVQRGGGCGAMRTLCMFTSCHAVSSLPSSLGPAQ